MFTVCGLKWKVYWFTVDAIFFVIHEGYALRFHLFIYLFIYFLI